jgi:C4-type Zn-finger protein
MSNRFPIFPCRSIPFLKKLMESCGTCAYCGGDNENLVAIGDAQPPSNYCIECIRCNSSGSWEASIERAVRAWSYSRR